MFKREHADAKMMVFDTTTFLNHVLDEPGQYGIKNTKDYCAAYDQPYINTDPGKYGCQPLDEFLYVKPWVGRFQLRCYRTAAGSTQATSRATRMRCWLPS